MLKRLIEKIDFNSIGMYLIFGGGNLFLCWLSKQIAIWIRYAGGDSFWAFLGFFLFTAPAIFYESIFSASNIGAWVSSLAVIVGIFISDDLRPRLKRGLAKVSNKSTGKERIMQAFIIVVAIPILLIFWAFQISITLLMSFFARMCILFFVIWPISILLGEPRIPAWLAPTLNFLINAVIWIAVIFMVTEGEEG